MNPAANKRKGADFESQAAAFLAEATGLPVERRRLNGIHDRGDLSGLTAAGARIVVECKATARPDVAGHLREAETERMNDGAAVGVVFQKRRGVGPARTGEQIVYMTAAAFATLVTLANGKGPRP